ncbi:MAG TPA: AMP-binding protein, partial [Actinomycetota bacterium]|nr:AMP-binding protein [Actinomycetota bacterium]
PSLTDMEVRALLDDLRPHRIEDESEVTDLDGGVRVASGTALVIPTSGASGRPKGVELSFGALEWSARAYGKRLGTQPGERWLSCLPLSHIGGLGILVRSRLAGTEPVIHDRFDPDAIAAERETTLISLVPTTLVRLLDAGVDLSKYSAVLLGGAGLPPAVADRARDAGVRLVHTYGLTETCGGCNFDGVALEGAEFRVVEERILARGPMLMSGYRLDPDLTAEALEGGWLHTGDRGRIGPDGLLEVFGRADDLIVTGGEKVSAVEVENLLQLHPRVADAAVAGVDDYRWGQAVAALIVPRGESPTLRELKTYLSGSIAAFKAPKRILITDEIPRTASGKVRRQAVRDLLEATEVTG